jgi:hypothetical protein
MIELDIEHSQVPSVQPRHEAPSRLRPPQRSRVAAGVKKYKYNKKYNTNTYNTKYTPPSGVFSFPGLGGQANAQLLMHVSGMWEFVFVVCF